MKTIGAFLSVLVIVIGLSMPAQATLVDMHDGTIYDTDTQLSWLKDAGAGGIKTWDEAVAWAAGLNSGDGFAGLKGWRLPTGDASSSDNTTGEMAHLYYAVLGNVFRGPLTNTGPFTNLQPRRYWIGRESESSGGRDFTFENGVNNGHAKDREECAWAVRYGARSH